MDSTNYESRVIQVNVTYDENLDEDKALVPEGQEDYVAIETSDEGVEILELESENVTGMYGGPADPTKLVLSDEYRQEIGEQGEALAVFGNDESVEELLNEELEKDKSEQNYEWRGGTGVSSRTTIGSRSPDY